MCYINLRFTYVLTYLLTYLLLVLKCCMQQFYGQSKVYSDVLDYLNMIFTGVFTIEFILKLFAFRIKVR